MKRAIVIALSVILALVVAAPTVLAQGFAGQTRGQGKPDLWPSFSEQDRRMSSGQLPQLVYLGDAVPTLGFVGWSLLSNGAGRSALLPSGRVNYRDR
jgi:hypothetical protein